MEPLSRHRRERLYPGHVGKCAVTGGDQDQLAYLVQSPEKGF